jgi:hypothetical protein
VSQAMPGIGEQRLNRLAFSSGVQPVHAVERGEVGLDRLDRHTERAELLRGIVNGRLISGDQQVEPMFGAAFG